MRYVAIYCVVAFGLVSLIMVAGSALSFPLTARTINAKRGESIFKARCASCHAIGAEGGSARGPSLARIGEIAGTRNKGQDAEQYVLTSILNPDAFRAEADKDQVMPRDVAAGLSDAELVDLVGFLLTKGGRLRPYRLLNLDIQRPIAPAMSAQQKFKLSTIEHGHTIFKGKGKCSGCHNSLFRGPDLKSVGLNTRDHIERSLRDPNAAIVRGYETWLVSVNGRPVTGRRLSAPEGMERLLVVDSDGSPRVEQYFEKDLDPLDDSGALALRTNVSTMPPVMGLLDEAEINALLTFLQTLR